MNSVLLKLHRQAEINIKQTPRCIELMQRRFKILEAPKMEREVYKRVGLWNMDDLEFYGDEIVFLQLLKIENMILAHRLLLMQYINYPHPFRDNTYDGITEIPIIAITPNLFVYEFKPPFDKAFFQNLINNECDILEFGNDYVPMQHGRCYATVELYALFAHQPSENVKRLNR